MARKIHNNSDNVVNQREILLRCHGFHVLRMGNEKEKNNWIVEKERMLKKTQAIILCFFNSYVLYTGSKLCGRMCEGVTFLFLVEFLSKTCV